MRQDRQTLADRLEALYARRTFGIKLGLEVEESILEELGRPERIFLPVHVAGTNGKGSVCAMMESVFRRAGYRTGLYTSPHLVRFNERIQTEGRPIADADLLDLWTAGEEAERRASHGRDWTESTFFEFTTALAFEYFRRRRVQVAVVEVGMGGRLDATNVVTPLVSVIAPVSLEHMEYLGRTVDAIAGEKAGIIKAGRPVVYAQPDPAAAAVIERIAATRGCRCVNALEAVRVERVRQDLDGQTIRIGSENQSYGTVRLALLGRHQLLNAALAVAALEEAFTALKRPDLSAFLKEGLEATRWPGRLQILEREPVTLLDGGHNPAAAEALSAALREVAGRKPVALVCGMCGDKDASGFFGALARQVKRVWTVRLRTPRSADPEQVAQQARQHGIDAAPAADLADARAAARAWALERGGAVCMAGSLFLAGEVLEACEREGGRHGGD